MKAEQPLKLFDTFSSAFSSLLSHIPLLNFALSKPDNVFFLWQECHGCTQGQNRTEWGKGGNRWAGADPLGCVFVGLYEVIVVSGRPKCSVRWLLLVVFLAGLVSDC